VKQPIKDFSELLSNEQLAGAEMKHQFIILIILAVFMGFLSPNLFAGDQDIVIIGHKNSPDWVTEKDIKQIFLGKKTRWDNGATINFVICNNQTLYEAFLKKYVRRSLFQYRNYWKMKVFNGTGRMPLSFKSEADVIAYVSATEGTVGFISSKAADKNKVKIIRVKRDA
jgi:ABC-type phosphate transport system substrate-binding protein